MSMWDSILVAAIVLVVYHELRIQLLFREIRRLEKELTNAQI